MDVTVISFVENESISKAVANGLDAVHTTAEVHRFPDSESRVRIKPAYVGKHVIIVCSLYHPDRNIIPLLFLAETLRDYGADRLYLVAPYLAYMRQDIRFHEGEGISARYFARLLSGYCDTLITVDPHLHRINSLEEIYNVPTYVVHAAPLVAGWIHDHINHPLLVGPDAESEQWVADLAQRAGAPYIVLQKTRHGDRKVEVSVPMVEEWRKHTPVLFDDIISTGKTMLETAGHLIEAGLAGPVCIGVHGVFSENAYQDLLSAGVKKVITTNSIQHESNAIDLSSSICDVLKEIICL